MQSSQALPSLFTQAEAFLAEFSPASSEHPPDEGRVRIYLRTFDGTMVVEADDEDLGDNNHLISPLFLAAHDVIAALCKASSG